MPRIESRPPTPYLYALPLILTFAHLAWFWGTGPVDDDYICFRYAANLLQGHGLVFNPGQLVEGYSTPLWVFLHAAWQALGGDSPTLSPWLGAAALFVCVAILSHLAKRKERWPWEALLVAAAPAMAWHSVAGLGTSLMAACLLLAYLSFDISPRQSGLWLALACALRQEFALFLIPIALAWRQPAARRALWAPAAILIGWTAFRLAYYGRWTPMTYDAKKLPLLADLGYGLRYFTSAALNLGWPLLLALAAYGALRQRRPAVRLFTAGVFLHSAYVIAVGGDFMVLSRFFVPTFPLLVALAWQPLWARPGTANALAVLGLLGMQWNQVGDRPEARETRLVLQLGFKQRWQRLGEHFRELAPPESKIALSPIGAFGWSSGLPIVDILGLTNESTLSVPPDLENIQVKAHHKSNFDWILDQDPEYVILGNGMRIEGSGFTICPWERDFFQSLDEGGRFPQRYRQASMDVGDGMPLDVFIRRDLELPRGTRWVAP